jgi:hypothetical protein
MAKKKPDYRKTPIIPWHIGESEEEFQQVQEELIAQTDRGAGVMGGSFLEWRVKQAIRTRLHTWDEETEHIFGTDTRAGELGFTDQCRMAYSLGLIGVVGLKDLMTIGKIRNRFAHQLSVKSFTDRQIADWCKSLRSPELWYEAYGRIESAKPSNRPRLRYIAAVQQLQMMIWSVAVSGRVRWPKRRPGFLYW